MCRSPSGTTGWPATMSPNTCITVKAVTTALVLTGYLVFRRHLDVKIGIFQVNGDELVYHLNQFQQLPGGQHAENLSDDALVQDVEIQNGSETSHLLGNQEVRE